MNIEEVGVFRKGSAACDDSRLKVAAVHEWPAAAFSRPPESMSRMTIKS